MVKAEAMAGNSTALPGGRNVSRNARTAAGNRHGSRANRRLFGPSSWRPEVKVNPFVVGYVVVVLAIVLMNLSWGERSSRGSGVASQD